MESVQAHYDSLIAAIRDHAPSTDLDAVNRAYAYAREMHEGQKRKDGSDYIIHPLAVAQIIAELSLDTDAILGALLHDCIEDTPATYQDIEERFGTTVVGLVDGVTKLTRVQYSTAEEQQMENLRKMFLAMSRDIRVIIIKICDRLHNMRTLEYQSPEKQISKSNETMEIYAPLAYRLGMQHIKGELEDTSLHYLDPEGYEQITHFLAEHAEEVNTFMKSVEEKILARLAAVGIQGNFSGRVKHVNSIYRKMDQQNKTLNQIYDLYAFRVIVGSISDCYNVLGHIHDLFTPVPGRFKDYISTPKANGYQSLHTTVIGEEGIPFEVQIRTWEMHEVAENGVAAHWKYKQDGQGAGQEQQYEWIRRLLENQQDTDAEEYVHSLKIDIFDDEVFVFTPKGKVISLPAGSTPIDFAYAIHSGVGNSMVGAKVNGHIASYDVVLQNGDIVEVLTSKTARGPSRDWLKLCHSNQARSKIKQWFKKERREENIVQGRSSMESELKRMNLPLSVLQDPELMPVILKKLSFDSLDDLYAAIGYGGITASKTVNRIREELLRATRAQTKSPDANANPLSPRAARRSESGVIVEDFDSIMIKFARCCTPVPGDDIVGFITKGYGVSVHRRDCPNARQATDPAQAGRWVKVTWADQTSEPFVTSLEIYAVDREALILDIATVMTGMRLKVTELNARLLPEKQSLVSLSFEVKDLSQLSSVLKKLQMISGVTDVRRGHS